MKTYVVELGIELIIEADNEEDAVEQARQVAGDSPSLLETISAYEEDSLEV